MTALDSASSVFDIGQPAPAPLPSAALAEILAQSGISPLAAVRRYAKTALGPGKLSFADFVRLRLFDDAFVEGPLDQFIGQRRCFELCHQINYRHDWFGLMEDKVTSRSYLAAYGLPTLPITALYAPGLRARAPHVLGDAAALEAFLRDPSVYPLFGKPVDGYRSLGSIGLAAVAPDGEAVEHVDGRSIPLAGLVREIAQTYAAGYVLQPLVRPHAAIEALCGPRLATVRVLTLFGADGPEVLGVAWKIPAGANVADNYWRAGNLLAQLDLSTGEVRRAMTGVGLELKAATHHPDTGVPLVGFRHPDWSALLGLALDGARLMRHMPLIGWDIAGGPDGPVIVEMNETPDFSLIQLAERKGLFTPAFAATVERQRAAAAARQKANQAMAARL